MNAGTTLADCLAIYVQEWQKLHTVCEEKKTYQPIYFFQSVRRKFKKISGGFFGNPKTNRSST